MYFNECTCSKSIVKLCGILSEMRKEQLEMKAMLVDLKAQIEVFTERRKYETWRA